MVRVLPYRWLVFYKLCFQTSRSKFADRRCLLWSVSKCRRVLKSICPRRIPCRQSQCAPTQTYKGFSRKHGSWRDERHSGLGVTVCHWSGFQSGNQNVTVITPELVRDYMTLKGLPKQEARGRMIHAPRSPVPKQGLLFLLGKPCSSGS